MKKIFVLSIAFLTISSCVSTRIEKVFKCDDPECLVRLMGVPTKIIDNGENGEIWEYSESNGAYSKFYIDRKNKVYNYETSYVLKRLSSAAFYTVLGLLVIGGGVAGWIVGGG
tara:strand:- start:48 stop:386 length:339 start_codon:yes stop_codon:yes gene_type:complete